MLLLLYTQFGARKMKTVSFIVFSKRSHLLHLFVGLNYIQWVNLFSKIQDLLSFFILFTLGPCTYSVKFSGQLSIITSGFLYKWICFVFVFFCWNYKGILDSKTYISIIGWSKEIDFLVGCSRSISIWFALTIFYVFYRKKAIKDIKVNVKIYVQV